MAIVDVRMSDDKRENVKPVTSLVESGNKILQRETLQNARMRRKLDPTVNALQAIDVIRKIALDPPTKIHLFSNVVEKNILTTLVPGRRK